MIPLPTPLDYLDNWAFEQPEGDHKEIARMISRYSPGGDILDLGCGPMLPAWALFHPRIEPLTGMDRNADNITLLQKFRSAHTSHKIFTAAQNIARALNIYPPALEKLYGTIENLRTGDITDIQPDWLGTFDVVTQIGCFACLPTNEDVGKAVGHVAAYLKPRGVFISVMWHAQPDYVEDPIWGGEERTQAKRPINAQDMAQIAGSHGLQILFEKVQPSDEIAHYHTFTMQAFRKEI